MNKILRFYIFVFCLFLWKPAGGQDPVTIHYTIQDGLPDNKIYSIRQDPDGYIWFATEKGVSKFDGTQFRNFAVADGLPANSVYDIYPDETGRIWLVDFNNGLHYLKDDLFHAVEVSAQEQNNKIFASLPQDSGKICLVKDNEYCRMYVKNDTVLHNTFYDRVCSQAADSAKILYCDLDKAILWKKGKGYIISKKSSRSFNLPDSAVYMLNPGRSLHTIKIMRYGSKIFFNVPGGKFLFIDVYDGNSGFLQLPPNVQPYIVCLETRDKSLQATTGNALIEMDTLLHVTDIIPLQDSLKYGHINIAFKDMSGNIWIGTYNNGVYCIPSFFRNIILIKPDHIPGRILKCIGIAGRQYYLNDSGQFYHYSQNGTFIRKISLPDLVTPGKTPENIDLLEDNAKGFYVSSTKGIYHLDSSDQVKDITEVWRHYSVDPEIKLFRGIKAAGYDRVDNRLFFAFPKKLYTYKPGCGMDTGIIFGRYNHILAAGRNEIWLSNDNGFSKWKKTVSGCNASMKATGWMNGFSVSYIIADSTGNILLQVDGKGVFIFYAGCIVPVLLPEQSVQRIKTDENGLWVVSSIGVKLLRLYQQKYQVVHFYPNVKNAVYDEVYDILSDSTQFILATPKGLLRMPLNNNIRNDSLFMRPLSVMVQFGKQHYERVVEIHPYWQKTGINFGFRSFSAAYGGDIHYVYYLEGIDLVLKATVLPFVSYAVLPPGCYRFHVRAVVNNTNISSADTIIVVNIRSLWWQSMWFKIAILLVLVIALFIIFNWRLRKVRDKLEYQSALKNKAIQMELLALQSQMNPHFIFNALAAVKSHFKLNRAAEAELLLEDFSLLIRMYLEFSKSQVISLQQEIRALQLYSDIEQRRFGGKFVVSFIIRMRHEHLQQWYIPPMILQPFVENAINHGLFRRPEQGGRLRLFFSNTAEGLCIIVDDNGIGREQAGIINQRIDRLFPSRGSSLITERIQVLNESGPIEIMHETIDKYNRDQKPAGTRVILNIRKRKL